MFTGESTLNVVAVHSTLHLPYDHKMYGQNLTVQVRKHMILLLAELCSMLAEVTETLICQLWTILTVLLSHHVLNSDCPRTCFYLRKTEK